MAIFTFFGGGALLVLSAAILLYDPASSFRYVTSAEADRQDGIERFWACQKIRDYDVRNRGYWCPSVSERGLRRGK